MDVLEDFITGADAFGLEGIRVGPAKWVTVQMNALKVVGKRKAPETPAECHALAVRQYHAAITMSPYPRPRRFVFKARTWDEWERWRRNHPNPWLW
jgi:hypothetical protein